MVGLVLVSEVGYRDGGFWLQQAARLIGLTDEANWTNWTNSTDRTNWPKKIGLTGLTGPTRLTGRTIIED